MPEEKKQVQDAEPKQTVKETFTKEELDNLTENVKKQAYQDGKTAGFEMTLKELKKDFAEKYGIETEGIKDYNTLFSKTLDTQLKNVKSNLSGEAVQIEEKYKSVLIEKEQMIAKLQTTVQETEKTYLEKLNAEADKVKAFKANVEINSFLANANRDVPDNIRKQGNEAVSKFLEIENDKAKIILQSKVKIDYDENGNAIAINPATGEIYKDRLQNAMPINKVLAETAKQYGLIQDSNNAQKGVINGDKQNRAIATFKTKEELFEYAKQNNINTNSNDFLKIYGDWKAAQNK